MQLVQEEAVVVQEEQKGSLQINVQVLPVAESAYPSLQVAQLVADRQ
jgi:hypothetical protein